MSELFPECRAFLEHELKKMEGCALTTTDHGKQNWMCKCLKEIKAMSIEPEPKQPPPETIDEYCGQPPGSFKQFVKNHPNPDMIAFTPTPEAGAVDVEKCLCDAAIYNPEHDNFYCIHCKRGMGQAFYAVAKQNMELERTLAQLEQENKRLEHVAADAKASVVTKENNLGLAQRRAEAAEARVKELEARLEAALKLTTENSIDYVNKV